MVPKDKGDLCYLITSKIIIPAWRAAPRWTTISTLRMDLVQKPDLVRFKSLFRGVPFTEEEIINQAALAFMEFYRRCGARYEDMKAKQNGDVYAGVEFSNSAQLIKGE